MSKQVKVTGYSDDLIEIEGAIRAEFSFYPSIDEEWRVVAFSDGTLLRVYYDRDGIWRFVILNEGSSTIDYVAGSVPEDRHDIVILTGDNLNWAVLASEYEFCAKDVSK